MKNIIVFTVIVYLSILNVLANETSSVEVNVLSEVTSNKNDVRNDKARNAVMALNYMHASLNKIITYNDKIILEDEYDNIINNLKLTAIEDSEIVDVITSLMDTLTNHKLSEMDKSQFQNEYEQKLDDSLSNALSSINAGGFTPFHMAGNILLSLGSAYFDYQSTQNSAKKGLDKSMWKLKKDTIAILNFERKQFLRTYWKVMKRYDMPESWRITEEQFNNFVNTLKVNDPDIKQRRLLRMAKELAVFPGFWYELSLIAHQNNDKVVENQAFKKYEELNDSLLRHNSHYSLMLANQTTQYDARTQKDEIVLLLKKIQKVDSLNPVRKLFVAMKYHEIGNTPKALELIEENIDDNFNPVPNQRVKLSIFLEKNDDEAFKNTIAQLLQQQNLSVGDYLYYFGQKPLPHLIAEIEKNVKNIHLEINTNAINNDDFVLNLPKDWVYKDVENTEVLLRIGDNTYKPSTVVRFDDNLENFYDGVIDKAKSLGDSITSKSSKIRRADNSLIYTYDDIIDREKFLDQEIKSIELLFTYNNLPIKIQYEVVLIVQEKNADEKSVDEKDSWYSKTLSDIKSKSKKLYSKYSTKITFKTKSIYAKDKCFNLEKSLEEC